MQTKGKRPIERGYQSVNPFSRLNRFAHLYYNSTLNLVGNTAILYGGSDGKSSFSDLWALDLGKACSFGFRPCSFARQNPNAGQS